MQGRGKTGLTGKQLTELEAAVVCLEADRGVKVKGIKADTVKAPNVLEFCVSL